MRNRALFILTCLGAIVLGLVMALAYPYSHHTRYDVFLSYSYTENGVDRYDRGWEQRGVDVIHVNGNWVKVTDSDGNVITACRLIPGSTLVVTRAGMYPKNKLPPLEWPVYPEFAYGSNGIVTVYKCESEGDD